MYSGVFGLNGFCAPAGICVSKRRDNARIAFMPVFLAYSGNNNFKQLLLLRNAAPVRSRKYILKSKLMKARFLTAVFLLLCLTIEGYGQQKKTFQFIPETVYPLGMRSRQVTAEFLLKVSPDTVVCYLPYFGAATGVDYASRKSSTDFTSVQFDYTESKGKRVLP